MRESHRMERQGHEFPNNPWEQRPCYRSVGVVEEQMLIERKGVNSGIGIDGEREM